MQVHDITVGTTGRIRSFSDIYPETQAFFESEIPSLGVREKPLSKTPFHISVKKLDLGVVFELYKAETLAYVTYCCVDPEQKNKMLFLLEETVKQLPHLPQMPIKPETELFLLTIPINPISPEESMLAGEIGFYIYHRIYALQNKY